MAINSLCFGKSGIFGGQYYNKSSKCKRKYLTESLRKQTDQAYCVQVPRKHDADAGLENQLE